MRKPIALFLIINFMVILLTVLYSFAAEERLVLTTYYPAPYGVYKEMRVDQMTVGSAYRYSGGLNDGYLFVDGRVGIGTTVPAVKLEVVENSYQFAGIRLTNNRIGAGNYSYIDAVVAAESAGDPAFRLRVVNGTGDWWSIGERNSDNNKLYISKGSDLSNPKLVINSVGNVGIGTTSPRAELEVNGPIIFLTGNETLLWDSKHIGTNDFRNFLAPMNSSGTYWDWNQEFGYHWGNRAWYFDGDVGIGTVNPGAGLEVKSGTDTTIAAIIEGNSALQTADLLQIKNNAAAAAPFVVVDSSGQVGIGTTNPTQRLELYGGDLLINNNATDNPAMIFRRGSIEDGRIRGGFGGVLGSGLYFSTQSQYQNLTILDNQGNLGIGFNPIPNMPATFTVQAKLHVKGDMKIFGSWQTRQLNTIYQTESDGFVVAYIEAQDTSGNNAWTLTAYSDALNNPTTIRAKISVNGYGDAYVPRNSLMIPVRKGNYFKITNTQSSGSSGSCSATIYWVPLGD